MTRLVVVSNRTAPIGKAPTFSGGLVAALQAGLDGLDALWFGWSGQLCDGEPDVPHIERDGSVSRVAIDLPRADYERYYNGFANRVLWPLLHYRISLPEFSGTVYAAYRRVNGVFAKQLSPLLQSGDVVWAHDYHLIPLASFLRAAGRQAPLGFFLHTPFPPPDVFATLPAHEDLVRDLLTYDVIGFQTDNDLHNFQEYVVRELGGDIDAAGCITAFGRMSWAGSFPIGIDAEAAAQTAREAMNSSSCRRLRQSIGERTSVIGVDRLDYSKGLLKRFAAIEQFLADHPDYRSKVLFLQVASPTRDGVAEYKHLRSQLDELIGHINGRFSSFDVVPVRYLTRSYSQSTLFGLYRMSKIALVTPLRDGMNLVAKEYVACQDPDDPGVLILSRFAGAARELQGALIVNPYDPAEIESAIYRALSMPAAERAQRYRTLWRAVNENSVQSWCRSFVDALSGLPPHGLSLEAAPALMDVQGSPAGTARH